MSIEVSSTTTQEVNIVIGASSVIAQALVENLADGNGNREIVTVSQQSSLSVTDSFSQASSHFQCDYSEESIRSVCQQLESRQGRIRRVFICNGILHAGVVKPEKRVEDIHAENLHKVFEVNAVTPMLWLKHLKSVLAGKQACVVTAFSARIGSIEDNKRGGWYAYRASKAALNMFLKTAAVEYGRSAKAVRFLVFHPGTTNTPLSKPFQKFVDEDKLFSPGFVAEQLLNIAHTVEKQPLEKNIQFLDWQGKSIPW